MAWDGVSRAPTTLRKQKGAMKRRAEAMRRRTERSECCCYGSILAWLGEEGLGLCKSLIWVENKGDPCLQFQGVIYTHSEPLRTSRVRRGVVVNKSVKEGFRKVRVT